MPTKKEYREYLRSNHWKLTKENKLKLAGYRCERCGVTSEAIKLNVHHIHYRTLNQEKPEDLQVVCDDCHRKADKDRVESDWDKAIKYFWRGRLKFCDIDIQGNFRIRKFSKKELDLSELEEKIYSVIYNESNETSKENLSRLMRIARVESNSLWRGNPYTSWLVPLERG
jgi:hypothetical protein